MDNKPKKDALVSKRSSKNAKYLKRVIRKTIREKDNLMLHQLPLSQSHLHQPLQKNNYLPDLPIEHTNFENDGCRPNECKDSHMDSAVQSKLTHSDVVKHSLPVANSTLININNKNESAPLYSSSHMQSADEIHNLANKSDIVNVHDIQEEHKECTMSASSQLIQADKPTLSEQLCNWAVSHCISHKSFTNLLQILNKQNNINDFTNLPSDCRTLLKHKINNDVVVTDSGRYYHFGIAEGLSYILKHHELNPSTKTFTLDINIDGLPLTKSSGSQFWPILGCFTGLNNHPFVIGLWHGFHKPHSSDELLSEFILEYLDLKINGYFYSGKKFDIQILKIICDAPAKSFILGVKGHNSYFGCTKCITEGTYVNRRVCYNDLNCPLRTDADFRSRAYADDYQIGTTLLTNIDMDLVQNIPLDYMHLVCLGVMKRLIQFWYKGNISVRMNTVDLELLNKSLSEFRNCISSQDFSRLPRPITECDRWKATEFRQFLLYSGPLVLKNRLKPSQYLHFVVLHCAIRILISPRLCSTHNSFAKELLLYFVRNYSKLYGAEYVTHNVHNLIHLPEDVTKFGSLDNFSAFKFENHMTEIKKNVRTCNKPLEQFINRFHEKRLHEQYPKTDEKSVLVLKPLILYQEPLLHNTFVRSYRYLILQSNCRIGVDSKNNHCILQDSTVVKIYNIIQCTSSGNTYIIFKRYLTFENYYDNPCGSDLFYCGRISNLSSVKEIVSIEVILAKCLNYKNNAISLVV